MAVTIGQTAFRLRNDDGSETTATWKAAQNVNVTQNCDTNLRVRFLMQNSGTTASNNLVAQLEVALNAGAYSNVNASSTVVRSSASPNLADAANITQQLTGGTGTFIGLTGYDEVDGAAGGASLDVPASGNFEVEYSIQIRSADVNNGDVINLKVTNAGTDFTGSYAQIPAIVAAKSVSLTPVVGALTLGGVLPGIINPVKITPSAGILRFGLQSYGITASTGTVTIAGAAPTIGAGATNTSITPLVGSLAIGGVLPGIINPVIITPSAGTLRFGLASRRIIPSTAGVTLTGNQPTISTGVNTSITPQTGTLTLTGNQPTVTATANVIITPIVAIVTIAPTQPNLLQNAIRGPPVGALALTGIAPSLLTPTSITPAAGALTLSGNAPGLSKSITPTAGALTLAGVAPTANISGVSITPNTGVLSLAGNTPTIQLSSGTTITPSAGILRFGLQSYPITPNTGALSITGQSARIGTVIQPSAGALTIGDFNQAITPDPAGLVITGNAPTVQSTSGVTRTPVTGTLAFSGIAPTLKKDTRITPTAGSLALSGIAGSLKTDTRLTPTAGTLTLSGNAPAVIQGTLRQPTTGALTLSGNAPGVSKTITPGTGALSLTGNAPAIQLSTALTITPGTGILRFGIPSHRVIPSTGTLALTGQTPVISTGGPVNTSITPATGTLEFGTAIIPPSLSLTGYPPIVTISGGTAVITPLVGSLTLTGQQPTVNRTVNVRITPLTGTLLMVGKQPAGRGGGHIKRKRKWRRS